MVINNKISNKTLFVCYGYEGKESKNANAICLYNLLCKVSKKDNYCVVTSGTNKKNKIFLDGILIVNVQELNNVPFPKSKKEIKNKLKYFKKNAINIIQEMLEKDKIVNIISISFPYVNLEIGLAIKSNNPNLRLLVYELDPYAYNELLRWPKLLFLYRWYKEKTIFKFSDKIFLTKELNILYRNNIYKRFEHKFVEFGIPMLDVLPNELVDKSNKECRIVYTGALSKKFRDPSFMLKLFSIIKDQGKWTLHIYGADRNSIDDIYIDKFKDKLFLYDKVPRSEVPNILKEASILLNISNNNTSQLPSKLLDYIGFRKPIINFYTKENDLCNNYLRKYPLKLSIKEDNSNEEVLAKNLLYFIRNSSGKLCDENDVKKNFNELSINSIYTKMINYL
ncbi:MAG: hypothetical protein PHW92_10165 [Lutibacter sp.]|nr:hypothetical protein [Lutibacter sp.]